MTRVLAGGVAVVAVLLAGAATAQAGTVTIETDSSGKATVRYTGLPGEASDGSISNTYDENWDFVVSITDRPLSIKIDASARSRCASPLPTTVSCRFPASGPQPAAYADLRDGADAFDLVTAQDYRTENGFASLEVQGGGGDDALHAASPGAVMRGGTGADRFTLTNANPYSSSCPVPLTCPPASETPNGATISTVSYQDHPRGVTVRVDEVANDGYPGEGDFVEAGLNVLGSEGSDTLSNDDAAENAPWFGFLDGAGGNDTIFGVGSDGPLRGGAGDDRVNSRDYDRDEVDCGPGTDALSSDPYDTSVTGCETNDVGSP